MTAGSLFFPLLSPVTLAAVLQFIIAVVTMFAVANGMRY